MAENNDFLAMFDIKFGIQNRTMNRWVYIIKAGQSILLKIG